MAKTPKKPEPKKPDLTVINPPRSGPGKRSLPPKTVRKKVASVKSIQEKARAAKPKGHVEGRGGKRSVGRPKGSLKFDTVRQKVFLDSMAATDRFYASCDAAGISTEAVYDRIKEDPKFKEKVNDARGRYLEVLREAILYRAIIGVQEPIIGGKNRDEIVALVNKPSDHLLMFEAKRTDKHYIERVQIDQKTETVHNHLHINLEKLPKEGRDAVRKLIGSLTAPVQIEGEVAKD